MKSLYLWILLLLPLSAETRTLQEHIELIAEGKLEQANSILALLAPVLQAEIVERWKPMGLRLSFD